MGFVQFFMIERLFLAFAFTFTCILADPENIRWNDIDFSHALTSEEIDLQLDLAVWFDLTDGLDITPIPTTAPIFIDNEDLIGNFSRPTPAPSVKPKYQFFPSNELDALYTLYNAAGGENWNWRPGYNIPGNNYTGIPWNFTGDPNPCTDNWQGLTCYCQTIASKQTCYIEEINLSDYNLIGTLPAVFGNFTILTTLKMDFNLLYGTLPEEIGSVNTLISLTLHSNWFTGTLPASLGNLSNLLEMNLYFNVFTGTIPAEFGKLSNLKLLKLYANSLTGSIPSTIGQLSNLGQLDLYGNFLNGTIPTEMYQLSKLKTLFLSFNNLSGSIAPEIANLTDIIFYNIVGNQITNTIPTTIGALRYIRGIWFASNNLTGVMPETIGNLTTLRFYDYSYNYLSGTLPGVFTILPLLTLVYGYTNLMTGTIPDFAGQKQLIDLQFGHNAFTGTLSETIFVSQLADFSMQGNMLTGPLPEAFTNCTKFYTVDLYQNLLSGSFPYAFGNLQHLTYLDLGSNLISGTLTEQLFEPMRVIYLYIDNNAISGSIPSLITVPNQLTELLLDSNQLTGPIPDNIGDLRELIELYLFNNKLTGTIPSSINTMKYLQQVFLYNNLLHGPLINLANPQQQSNLSNIDVSNNAFTGEIPSEVFFSTTLQSFAASTNCLTGSIPREICLCDSLTALALDGLSSADNCRNFFFPRYRGKIDTYSLQTYFGGGIPECLYGMPNLHSLHISGNGLFASIPADVVVSDNLTDLSLSHNLLYGTIPLQILNRAWVNLDLSYNQLQGILSVNMPEPASDSAITLEVNRISGNIPSSLKYTLNISVLNGNLFDCSLNRQELPVHDPVHDTYQCGSDAFNRSIYMWLAMVGILGGVLLLLFVTTRLSIHALHACLRGYRDIAEKVNMWLSVYDERSSIHINNLLLKQQAKMNSVDGLTDDVDHEVTRNTQLNTIVTKESFLKASEEASIALQSDKGSASHQSSSMKPSILAARSTVTQPDYIKQRLEESLRIKQSSLGILIRTPSQRTVATNNNTAATAESVLQPQPSNNASISEYVSTAARAGSLLFNQSVIHFGKFAHSLRIVSSTLTIFIVFILLPVYLLLSHYLPTYTYQYAWTFSATFQSGTIPAVTLVLCFTGLMLFVFILFDRYLYQHKQIEVKKIRKTAKNTSDFGQYLCLIVVALMNFAVMVPIDVAYVYITINYDVTTVVLTQMALAVFKLLWNDFAIRTLLNTARSIYFNTERKQATRSQSIALLEWQLHLRDTRDVLFLVYVVLINNIAIPCFAIAAVSSDCFKNVFIVPPAVNAFYEYTECVKYFVTFGKGFVCLEYGEIMQTITYDPPFLYSYQCSSIFAVNYSTIYVYMFIIIGIVHPTSKILLTQLFYWSLNSTGVKGLLHKCLNKVVPFALKPLATETFENMPTIFDKQRFIIRINNHLAILMTYGALCPPLAVIICIGIFTFTFFEQIVIGRLLINSRDQGLLFYHDIVENELKGVSQSLLFSFWVIIPFASIFYAYFVFDTLGDAVGWRQAVWAPCTVACIPIIIRMYRASREWYVDMNSDSAIHSRFSFMYGRGSHRDELRKSLFDQIFRPHAPSATAAGGVGGEMGKAGAGQHRKSIEMASNVSRHNSNATSDPGAQQDEERRSVDNDNDDEEEGDGGGESAAQTARKRKDSISMKRDKRKATFPPDDVFNPLSLRPSALKKRMEEADDRSRPSSTRSGTSEEGSTGRGRRSTASRVMRFISEETAADAERPSLNLGVEMTPVESAAGTPQNSSAVTGEDDRGSETGPSRSSRVKFDV